ncbi:unannotated protein [freshwater metagenome]|uniref:Unannotated protein n=1 Tax=freshwater metagenome TaxID=449393 RepID=A0A6J7EGI8_9ZZZZ|nr:hypothetical protein [Actinomycetota bacterium]
MRKISVVLSFLLLAIGTPNAQAADANLKVMSRNIYVGSDVGVAMKLIPDFKAAAQFMWDQVSATDFSKRAPLLAKEIITNKADVVGIQEATTWVCKKNAWSGKTEVLNFTDQLLAATKNLGTEYVVAEKDGTTAKNIGFSIAAIPFLTIVNDPKTFQPLFGQDTAACGFEIGDALIIRKDLASQISKVGNTEYDASYSIVPTLMTIYRGYTWMDLQVGTSTVRIVSTHLESVWDANKVPNAAKQAKQLVSDLSNTSIPTIVIGDFNADPRDPRKDAKSNPGGQPEASETCPIQVENPTVKSSIDSCNAYWVMRKSGYLDVGPDALNATNFTWGGSALLAGPDLDRYKAGKAMGNAQGFTDRLDYVFYKNGVQPLNSKIVGNIWPYSESTWVCDNEEQINNTQLLANEMKVVSPETGVCMETDHAGLFTTLAIPAGINGSTPDLPSHAPFPISFWQWVGLAILALIAFLIIRRRRRRAI